MKIKFYLKRPDSKTTTSIYGLANYDGNTMKFYPGESINPKHWNKKTQTARNTPSFPEHPEFNERLNQMRSLVNRLYLDYRNKHNHATPSPDVLRGLVEAQLSGPVKSISFLDFFDLFVKRTVAGDRIDPRTKRPVKPGPAKGYGTTLNKLTEFAKTWEHKLNFNTINVEFHTAFTQFLAAAPNTLSVNTIGSHIKRIKAVMNDAIEMNVTASHGHKSKFFVKQSEEADTIYLSTEELQDMRSLDLSEAPHLDNARDLFLIGCYTGLRYSDFSVFNPHAIVAGFIKVKPVKTGDPIVIPIHPVVKAIIDKNGGEAPRSISNQKLNDYLKDIGKKMESLKKAETKEITKGGRRLSINLQKWQMLSSHTARRSFATNEYLAGTPSITIMAITGHKTEKAFLKYIRVTPDEHARKIKELWNKRDSVLKAI